MTEVITAAFEQAIEQPQDEAGDNFLFNLIAGQKFDDFLFLCVNAGLESLTDEIIKTMPELEGKLIERADRTLGMTYDSYNLLIEQNIKSMAMLTGIEKPKRPGPLKWKLPILRFRGSNVPRAWTSGSIRVDGGSFTTYDALVLSTIRWAGNRPGSFIKSVPFVESILEDLYSTKRARAAKPLDETIDRELFDYFTSIIEGFEVRGAFDPPSKLVDGKLVPVTEFAEGIDYENRGYMADVPLTLYAVVTIPVSVAQYASQSENPDTRLCYEWFRDVFADFAAGKPPAVPAPINPLPQVVEDMQGIREIKLSNDDGLTTLADGTVLYIPEVRSLDTYNAHVDSLNRYKETGTNSQRFDPYATEVEGNNVSRLKGGLGLKNRALYTDWRMNIFSYLTTEGIPNLTFMDGAKPGDASTVLRLLDTNAKVDECKAAIADIEGLVRLLGTEFSTLIRAEDFRALIPASKRDEMLNRNQEIGPFLQSLYYEMTMRNKNWPYNSRELTPSRLFAEVRATLFSIARNDEAYDPEAEDAFDYSSMLDNLDDKRIEGEFGDILKWPGMQSVKRAIDIIAAAIKAGGEPLEKMLDKIGVYRFMTTAPFYLAGASVATYAEAVENERVLTTQYREMRLDPDYTPKPVPNINGNVSLLPHQVKADQFTAENADAIIQAVQAGGGKTFLGLIDGLRSLGDNERVAIIMPGYLIPNYLEDGQYMCSGQVNFLVVNNDTFGRYGEERLTAMIQNGPVNTISLWDLNVFSTGKNVIYSYNGVAVVINQIVEFCRSLGYTRIIIDESHKLANPDSNRTASVGRALGGVQKRREMTGTFINNTVVDALGQVRLLNPDALGDDKDFNQQYAIDPSRPKLGFKPRAPEHIIRRIKRHANYVQIRRKEWVALLPDRDEEFIFCDLSERQEEVYNAILGDMIAKIQEDPKLAALLKSGKEEDAPAIEAMLKKFLQRIERFLASCDLDPLGREMLDGADLVSPKSEVVNERLAMHFSDPDYQDGKVLIFTSYKDSAKSIYEHLDPKWKKMALHYTAEDKDQLLPLMKKDPNVRIVVGVEDSLNTGHNFQMFNRLIRIESVWNPGTLDQAESRLNRPDPKNKTARRKKIAYDWVCCNNTIDVTKVSRLISKLINAVKFEEHGNSAYDGLNVLPSVSMNFDNIIANNSFDDTLKDYLEEYRKFLKMQERDFANYRENAVHKDPLPLPSAGILKGSALMDVPYVSGMVLPFQRELGLQNLSDFAIDNQLPLSELSMAMLKGRRVHTEHGDGEVVAASKGVVRVQIGREKISVDKTAAFLIPQKFKGTVRDQINELIGLRPGKTPTATKATKATKPVATPKSKRGDGPVDTVDEVENMQVEVFLAAVNNTLAVNIDAEDPDMTPELAQKLGMVRVEPYYYAEINTYQQLDKTLDALMDKFKLAQSQLDVLEDLLEKFSKGKQRLFNIDQVDVKAIKSFVLEGKRSKKADMLYVYPYIDGDQLFLCAWADQPAAKRLPRLSVPGVRWKVESAYYARYFQKKSAAKSFLDRFEDFGVEINNLDAVKQAYDSLIIV